MVSVTVALPFAPPAGMAQESARIPRIGLLGPSGGENDPLVQAFRHGLRDLGYVEGQTVRLEYGADAAALVQMKVDVIVASSQRAVQAREATSTIPIVMPIITDPVRLGLVASLVRPGGNATGFATQNDELAGKWLELAREAVPRALRVAVLFHPTYDGGVQFKAAERAARALGVRLLAVNVERAEDFATAFAEVQQGRPDALVVSSSPLFYANRSRIVEFAAAQRLPTIYHQSEFVTVAGGLMSYGPDFRDLFRRSATYVDRILKGARPADLPVQQPTKFELVINRRAARAIGFTIPQSLVLRAARIIE